MTVPTGAWALLDFNPRPPRGGRLPKSGTFRFLLIFQSTPPARGATSHSASRNSSQGKFQSTPPARGATPPARPRRSPRRYFNPRPPRGGRRTDTAALRRLTHFNPRPPRGGRHPFHAAASHSGLFQSTPPARGATFFFRPASGVSWISIHAPREGGDCDEYYGIGRSPISIHAPREGGDSKDAQFYLRIFDKQVELLRFLGKIRGGCLRNPEKDRRFFRKSLANLPAISGHLDFAGSGKARPGYPCAVPLPRRAACVRGSGDPPADRCSSYRNAPLFSHIASPDSKSADCLSQNP